MKFFYENIDENLLSLTKSVKTYPSHFHKGVEILYVTKGELSVIVNGKFYVLHEKQLIFIDENDVHSVVKSVEYYTLLIPIKYLDFYLLIKKGKTVANRVITDVNEDYEKVIFSGLTSEKNEFLLQSRIYQIFSLIEKDANFTKQSAKQLDGLREVYAFVTENFTENLTLEFLSKKFGYNKCYLSNAFNSLFNISFNNYLTKLRLQEFIKLILGGEKSTITAIFNSGFTSEQTFYRTFKKVYGVNPKTYFKNLKNN